MYAAYDEDVHKSPVNLPQMSAKKTDLHKLKKKLLKIDLSEKIMKCLEIYLIRQFLKYSTKKKRLYNGCQDNKLY